MQKFSRTTAVIATVALAGALGACAEQPRYGSQYPASQPTYSSYPTGAPAPAGMEYISRPCRAAAAAAASAWAPSRAP